MKEIILLKYGEMALKGLNKSFFEKLLTDELSSRLSKIGNFKIRRSQSTVFVEPQNTLPESGAILALDGISSFSGSNADYGSPIIDEAVEICKKVFGIASVTRALEVPKNMDDILNAAKSYIPRFMKGVKTFKCDGRRSDKRFPMTSPQLAGEVGGALLSVMPHLKVDLNNPDIVVMTEIRENAAYIHAGTQKGACGMPYGSNGKGLLLLSGGIDSPVAGYLMAKRGVALEALYFESYPYTSIQAREKVLELARILTGWCGRIFVHVVSLTRLQEELRDKCDEEYFTLLLRRSMMRIANRVADRWHASAIITGESLGQVASQTILALGVTNDAANYPVFRPCIGMDKEEIVQLSRKIGTYDTSILPYEDCCTVFTPKHPKTRPELDKVIEQEQLIDYEKLENEAYESAQDYRVE